MRRFQVNKSNINAILTASYLLGAYFSATGGSRGLKYLLLSVILSVYIFLKTRIFMYLISPLFRPPHAMHYFLTERLDK